MAPRLKMEKWEKYNEERELPHEQVYRDRAEKYEKIVEEEKAKGNSESEEVKEYERKIEEILNWVNK